MSPLNLKAIREIKGLKSQTITTALVALCGIAVQIGYVSAYVSLNSAKERFYTNSRFADIFATVKRAPESVLPTIRNIPGIQQAETGILYEASLRVAGLEEGASARIVSIGRHDVLNKIRVSEGRMPEVGSATEACVSEGFAHANHLGPGSTVEALINGKSRQVHIVCIALSPEYIYAIRAGSFMPDDKHYGIFWMTREALTDIAGFGGSFNALAIALSPGTKPPDVLKSVDRILDPYGNPGAYARDKQLSNVFLNNELYQLQVMGYSIPIIFLGVAAFLLHIVIGRLINRQREQIATLKAVGYSNLQVGLHYLSIVTFMTLSGALPAILPGIWLGQWTTEMYKDYMKLPDFHFVFDPMVPLWGILFAIVASFLGALSSLKAVMKLNPAEAMRPPAPPRYEKTFIEKAARLTPFTLMGFRHVALKPFQSILSVAGLSMAGAIIVMGFIWTDMVQFLLTVQFNSIQREDVMVNFQGPRPTNVLGEMRVIPGVIYVEGYRIAPIRLHAGHRTKEMALTGLPEGARLRRILKKDFRPNPIPASGILLNESLAKTLSLHPGDIVTLELLEGDRRQVSVPIAGLAEELLGSGAYMEISKMNALLREGPVISTAALSVDLSLLESVQRELRSMPYILSVDSKLFVIRMFHSLYADMLLVMALMLIGFASVIAIGVVYNTVMVALAERSWELASLRVLGFTQGEVFQMLLVELTLQIIVAIPFGVLLGYYMNSAMLAGLPEDQYHFPIILQPYAVASCAGILIASAAVSSFLVWQRIKKLDLVSVLKVRE